MVFGRKKKKEATVAITDAKQESNEISPQDKLAVRNSNENSIIESPQNVPDSKEVNENEKESDMKKIDESNIHSDDERIEPDCDIQDTKTKKTRRRKHGDIILKREETINVILKYQMGQKELKMLQKDFRACDQDNTNSVNYDEFFLFINEKRTKFTDAIFNILKLEMPGSANYEEFVEAVVTYGMYTREELLRFVFDSFDVDDSGSINEAEFRTLCDTINDGKPVFPGSFKKALQKSDRDGDGLLDFEEFQRVNIRFPLLLFPCFRLQDRIQKSTLTEKHWLQLAIRYCKQLKLIEYKRKHNGVEPPTSFWKKIKRAIGIHELNIYQE